MNWMANRFFVEEHLESSSEAFKDWWEEEYGPPPENKSQAKKYWERCGHALEGWNAAVDFGGALGGELDFGE